MNQEFFNLQELPAFATSSATKQHTSYCCLGLLATTAATLAQEIPGLPGPQFYVLLDSHGIRHTLAQHGTAKSQLPVAETDMLALANWLPSPTIVRAGQPKPGK